MKKQRMLFGTIGLIVVSLVLSGCFGLFGPKTGSVSGKVTWDDSVPVVGAQVNAGDQSTTTGAGGTYKLEGLEHGTYDLTVTVDGQVLKTQKITVDKSAVIQDIKLTRPEPDKPMELVLIRSELTENAKEKYPDYGKNMDALIEFLAPDYDFVVLTNAQAAQGGLSGAKLVVLNDQGVMDDDDVAAITAFTAAGGNVFATYSTSIRNAAEDLVGFQLSDVYGVRWDTFTTENSFAQIVVIEDHPMLQDFDGSIAISGRARHRVFVDDATVLGVLADEDGNYGDVEQSALLTVSENGVYVSFSLFTPAHFANEDSVQLIHAIIDHYAPGARR